MSDKKGNGLLMVYSDVATENDEEYNRWYNEEHIPERLSIPGAVSYTHLTLPTILLV